MRFRFVHAADLHLDSPMLGLERYAGAPVEALRGATRRALENLVDLCLEEQVELLLLAGDLYDGDWRDYGTGLFFCAQMSRLREAGVQVVLLRGNHDAQSQLTRTLSLPANVQELPVRHPGTLLFEQLGVAVHGQGFEQRAVEHDLTQHYPPPLAGLLNIGLLHTCLDERPGHARYAPSSREVLMAHGYDYWALGHVHTREIVSREPWIVYPGNLQGRHMREQGAKGATLVEVVDGRIQSVQAKSLDVIRWHSLELDAELWHHPDDLLGAAQDALSGIALVAQMPIAARIIVSGRSALHGALQDGERWLAELRRVATDVGGVWLESAQIDTRMRVDLNALRSAPGPAGQLAQSFERLRESPSELAALSAELGELERRLPRALRDRGSGLSPDDPPRAREELDAVEQLLLPLLFEAGGEP